MDQGRGRSHLVQQGSANSRNSALTNERDQCQQDKGRCGQTAAFMYGASLTYDETVGRQTGTLARSTIAERQRYQGYTLDLALARQHQNQTMAGSFLRWLTGGQDATAAAMSAVATADGPILNLMQELQTQFRNSMTTVGNLGAELSTARETHTTALKDKDEAHATELEKKDKAHSDVMAAKDKAHNDAMAARDAAHATAMSGRNQTLRTIRRERNTCRTDLANRRKRIVTPQRTSGPVRFSVIIV